MADQMKPGVVNDPKHNVGARNETVQKAFKERFLLEQERDEAKAKHVDPVSDKIKALNRKLKKDVDIDGKDLDLHYKLFKRQETAKQLDDEADRDRILENLRATFEAIGGQLDFISAINSAQANNDGFDEPSEAVLKKARAAGRADAENSKDANSGYPEDDPCHKAYMDEWLAVQKERAEKLGGPAASDEEAA